MATPTLFQCFRDTYANLAAIVPYSGEPFLVSDWNRAGVGDGSSTVAQLMANPGADYTLTTAGTTTPTIPAAAANFDLLATIGAGSGGSFTRKIVLATTNRRERDKVTLRLEMPANANPTVEIRNADASGTTLLSQPGDSGAAVVVFATFIFRSGAWVLLNLSQSQA